MDLALLRIITQNEEAVAKVVNEQVGIAAAFPVGRAGVPLNWLLRKIAPNTMRYICGR